MKCRECGREFEKKGENQVYCTPYCYMKANEKRYKIKNKISRVARQFDFDVCNRDKIVNAKMMMFSADDVFKCPCDANNPNRYCGSALCIADTIYKGHCCCQLFWSKKEPELTKYLEKKEK